MLIFSIAAFAIAFGFAGLSFWKIPAWRERGYGDRNFKWKLVIGSAVVSSLATSYLAYWLSNGSVYSSLAVGVLGYLLVLSSTTDFALMKIPSEPTTLAQFIGVPVIIWLWPSFSFDDKLSLAVWFGIVLIFAVLSFLRFFGWADVKLMFAFGTLLAWWVGPLNMMLAFLGSAIIALLMMPALKLLGLTVKKTTSESTVWNAEKKIMEAVKREEETSVDVVEPNPIEVTDGTPVEVTVKKKRKRTYVPFGPSLLLAFVATGLIASAIGAPTSYGWGQEDPMPDGFCFVLEEGANPADFEGLTICPH
ncbi:MAG: prepilin peptidase [Enterococcus sp.]|nr:prepilin peptidase [Enterococcus sp.]